MNEALALQDGGSPTVGAIKVFVHLAHGFGRERWTKTRARGTTTGIADVFPYGYHLAADDSCIIRFSTDHKESSLGRFARLCLRRVLGFDPIHAWHNREQLCNVDAVWTHTELEHLAVLLLWRFKRLQRRPKLIAQSVWMYDSWWKLSAMKRWLFTSLLSQADLLTVLSSENLKVAKGLFPAKRIEFIPFGINSDQRIPVTRRQCHRPLHVLALGRDMHRDWVTLVGALGGRTDFRIKIGAPKIDRRLIRVGNVSLEVPADSQAIRNLYDWADMVVVPLKANLHASGITVLAEAALFGVPAICSDTGGLRAYFSDEEVRYVPIGDVRALREAALELAANNERRLALAVNAQKRIVEGHINSRSYALRHRELTRQLIRTGETDDHAKTCASENGFWRRCEDMHVD